MLRVESLSSSSISEVFSLPENGSYEVSFWFQNNVNRLNSAKENINRQLLAKKRKEKEERRRKEAKSSERKKRILTKIWKKFSSKIMEKELNRRLNIAKNKLQRLKNESRNKKRRHNRTPPQISSKTSSEFIEEVREEEEVTEIIMIDTNSPNGRRWKSFSRRFMKQTMYNNLLKAKEDLMMQQRKDSLEMAETWRYFAKVMLQEQKQSILEKAAADLATHREQWNTFVNEVSHKALIDNLQKSQAEYTSHKFKNPDDYKKFWRKSANYQLKRERALKYLRESIALETLTRFFRYIIIPIRSAKAINNIDFQWKDPMNTVVRNEVYSSARKIKNSALSHRHNMANNFAKNFTSCISEACSSIALYHLGKPAADIQPPFSTNKEAPKPKANKKVPKKPAQKTIPKPAEKPTRRNKSKINKKVDSATDPVVIPPPMDPFYSEEESSESSVVSQLDEAVPVDIHIDNNGNDDIPNVAKSNFQVVHIVTEMPEAKPQLELIKGDTETLTPDEVQKENIAKRIQVTNQLNINEVIQIPPEDKQKTRSSSSYTPEISQSPNISTIVEMYNSGSALEEIDSSFDEVVASNLDISTDGSPIKRSEYTEEESLLTTPISPDSVSSIRRQTPSARNSSNSFRRTYISSSSQAFAGSNKGSNEVNLLEENYSKIFTFEKSTGITDFNPYTISDDYEEEEEMYEESQVDFIFNDDYEEDNEEENDSEAHFVFDDNDESQTPFSQNTIGSANFVFDTSSVTQSSERNEEEGENSSPQNEVQVNTTAVESESVSNTGSDRVISFSENNTESDNSVRRQDNCPPLTPPIKQHIPEQQIQDSEEYYEEDYEEEEDFYYEDE